MIFLLAVAAMLASIYLYFTFVGLGGVNFFLGYASFMLFIYAAFEGLSGLYETLSSRKKRKNRP